MFSFFLKQKTAFGLDVSEFSLRAMQLQRMGSAAFPKAFCYAKMPKGLITDDKITNPGHLAEFIKKCLADPQVGQIDTPYVVFSVPESKSFVRVITVPKMSAEEAKEAVPLEAEQYIPMAAEQVYLDFKIVPAGANQSPDKMKVVICATPRDLVDSYVEAIKLARLKPVAAEVESEAVARSLVDREDSNEPTMILDVGYRRSNLVIFDQGTLQFTSSLPIGSETFTSQIAQSLTVTLEEAEKLKRQYGLLTVKDGGKIRKSLQSLLNSMIEAIKNTLNFYKEHSDGSRKIARILLAGGGGQLKGLAEFLSQELRTDQTKYPSLEIKMGDPWVNALERPLKKIPPISKIDSVGFSTVIGLALRGLDME